MKNRAYWRYRALKSENKSYLVGLDLLELMFAHYKGASKDIEKSIQAFYAKYASKHDISLEDAQKILNNKELQEFKEDLGAYVDRINAIDDPEIKRVLTMELDALSYNAQMTRLDALNGQVHMRLNELFAEGVKESKKVFGEVFKEAYYRKAYDIQMRAGIYAQMARVPEILIESVLNYPWSGGNFSDALWYNKNLLIHQTRTTITQGLIKGDGIATMSKRLGDRMGASYKNAERIVRTEVSHFQAEADKKVYEDLEIDSYEYIATLDDRTCSDCSPHDGEIYKLSELEEGKNYPVMHPNCRCTTVDYDPYEEQDWIKSGHPMPEGMSYDEWKKKQSLEVNFKEKSGIINEEILLEERLDYIDPDTKEKAFIPAKTIITNSTVLAQGRQIRTVSSLIENFGGEVDDWYKKAGKIESDLYIHDVHWYENNNKQYKMKLKNRTRKEK